MSAYGRAWEKVRVKIHAIQQQTARLMADPPPQTPADAQAHIDAMQLFVNRWKQLEEEMKNIPDPDA